MIQVVIIGCGVVGATIAYELSQVKDISVIVCDRNFPAQASTGAALGVLMGVISRKTKGRAMTLRLRSIARYPALLAELAAKTGQPIPHNRQGILRLCHPEDNLESWQQLINLRKQQGWPLSFLPIAKVRAEYPELHAPTLTGAIFSPADLQVDPVALTQGLVRAAEGQGARFQLGTAVMGWSRADGKEGDRRIVHTSHGDLLADWIVVSAGLGSTLLTATQLEPVEIQPVLGQAMRLRSSRPLAIGPSPVITSQDTHLVPLGQNEYWIGATVEFPTDDATLGTAPSASSAEFAAMWQRAITICPALAESEILQTWSGLRPRPMGRSAPVIDRLNSDERVWLATGHYRNGVLLAPATALVIRDRILES